MPTPNNGHAFILRRYDTGAVSLTTMFRAAFPEASEEDEKNDAAWIKASYDIAGANGGFKGNTRQYLRLAGTWLPVEVALAVAESYAIHNMVKPLTEAQPDSAQHFRKSTNGTQEVQEVKRSAPAPAPASTVASPPAKALSPPAKRRKAASPTVATVPLSPPAPTRKLRSSKSPAPTKVHTSTTAKPRSSKRLAGKSASPPIEDRDEDVPPEVGPVDPEVDIEESKKLVEEVKSTYAKRELTHAGSDSKVVGVKRTAEDEPLRFEPKEPEVGERAIAGPRRLRNLSPQRQAAAWGALVFAIGLGAT